MSPSPKVPYAGLHMPDAETEQKFIRLATHAAIWEYREPLKHSINRHGQSVTKDIRCRHTFLEMQILRKSLVRHRGSPRLLRWPESLREIEEPGFHA